MEWSRQSGMGDALLVGLPVALGKGHPLTCALGALFWASWFRGSAPALLGQPSSRTGCGGLSERQGDMATWNPEACHLCCPRLRCLGPRIFHTKGPQMSSGAWFVAAHKALGWADG